MAPTNRERVASGLELLRDGLRPYVEREMKVEYKGAWIKQAAYSMRNVPFDEANPHFDSAALLIIMWDNWDTVFKSRLGYAERSLLSELREWRNTYAHEKPFSTNDADRALDSMARLLRAVSAPEAAEVERMREEMLRLRYSEIQRAEKRKVAAEPLAGAASTSLKPWREIITPHPDVSSGYFDQAQFAADLQQVYEGKAMDEYGDPRAFFARTYLTEGLRTLLIDALRRLDDKPGGNPVVNLQTNFGGGKTHSMLSLYHLFSGAPLGEMPGVESLVKEAGAAPPAKVYRAVLVGQGLTPGQPQQKPDGVTVRTLWGELAWQLGGAAGYEMVRGADETGTNPGATLRTLLSTYSPCLILIDEWVAYARQLHEAPDLPGGSFDTQMTFAQNLGETLAAVPRAQLVFSLPASDIEAGGDYGARALKTLSNTIGRVDNPWRPASQLESYEIVRRRLFQEIPEANERLRENVIARFSKYYSDQPQEFPDGAGEVAYKDRMRSAYPIHPELFDRLYTDWSSLERFQRTRGVLRLMAKVIHSLWIDDDASPLILPAHIPLHDPNVQQELTRYLEENWVPIIEADVDGGASLPRELDKANPNFGRFSASRRVARTVFLGSAPTHGARLPGIDVRHIKLGSAQPGDAVSTYGDALRRLSDQAMHLYVDQSRYWYSTRPSVARTARERAAQFEKEDAWAELVRRLQGDRQRGVFAGVHVAPDSGDVPDDGQLRLVVLGPEHTHVRKGIVTTACQAALAILANRGAAPRIHKNMLLFVAPDGDQFSRLEDALRAFLAWKSIYNDRERLNLDAFQTSQAQTRMTESENAVNTLIGAVYYWLLIPVQDDWRSSESIRLEEFKLQGSDPLAVRAGKRAISEALLVERLGGVNLQMEMTNRNLWKEADHVTTRQLWGYFTDYVFLPRLLNPAALQYAIEDGIGRFDWPDYFAYADAWDESKGKYIGLRAGEHATVRIDTTTLVVRPQAAQRQMERERAPVIVDASEQGSTGNTGAEGNGTLTPPSQPPTPPAQRLPTRYHATVPLNLNRLGLDASTIANEVIVHLSTLPGARVTVTLEIQAEIPEGAPEGVQRTVTANGQSLRFDSHGFDME